eukprot:m.87854 g.87854  ORF g.87854 m.87854 type:complete len:936 (+) comp13596_c0_seq1:303-3110(+)
MADHIMLPHSFGGRRLSSSMLTLNSPLASLRYNASAGVSPHSPLQLGPRRRRMFSETESEKGSLLDEEVPLLSDRRGPAGKAQAMEPLSINAPAPGAAAAAAATGGSGGHPTPNPNIIRHDEMPPGPPISRVRRYLNAVLYGLVNSVILIPVVISFAQIIFRDAYFSDPSECAQCMPYVVKLVILSSLIHQACFTLKSSLTFAIGQVQDAGLIFLSAMASSIVSQTRERGATHDEILATVLCWLALSTAMLGLGLMITGTFRLASLVQYLPMPVVGGYLAFIGQYCLEAGMGLMSARTVTSFTDWPSLCNREAVLLVLPGVFLGLLLVFLVQRIRHFLVLPIFLLAIPGLFYLILGCTGTSLDDARTVLGTGFVAADAGTSDFWKVWQHYDVTRVQWYALPAQIPTWFAMFFVVAFSSCLDVAAIQMELGRPLDYNHELRTVGLSNLISGATGGFTGSYIFSQTIFTMRARVESRLVGVVVVLCSLITFALPFSVLAYFPKFLFGAILVFIAFDLLSSWLYHSWRLVRRVEYFIIWATFIAINALNLEYGMLIGIGVAVLVFIFEYSNSRTITVVSRPSKVVRSYSQRQTLNTHAGSIVAIQLFGYLFFGSAVRILRDVKRSVTVYATPATGPACELQPAVPLRRLDEESRDLPDAAVATRYLVLDCSHVTGLDATAVRTFFVALHQALQQHGVTLVVTDLTVRMAGLLRAHKVLGSDEDKPGMCLTCATLEDGLEWCEDMLLDHAAQAAPAPARAALRGVSAIIHSYLDAGAIDTAAVADYVTRREFSAGETLFSDTDPSDTIYFLERGQVAMYAPDRPCSGDARRHAGSTVLNMVEQALTHCCFGAADEVAVRQRLYRYDDGGVFGQIGFMLNQNRMMHAETVTSGCLYALHRKDLAAMERANPPLALAVHTALMKSVCLALANAQSSSGANR